MFPHCWQDPGIAKDSLLKPSPSLLECLINPRKESKGKLPTRKTQWRKVNRAIEKWGELGERSQTLLPWQLLFPHRPKFVYLQKRPESEGGGGSPHPNNGSSDNTGWWKREGPEQRERFFLGWVCNQKELSRQVCQGERLFRRPPICSCPPLLHSSHLVTGLLLVKLLEGKSLGVVLRMREQIKSPLLPAVGKAELKPWSHDWQRKAWMFSGNHLMVEWKFISELHGRRASCPRLLRALLTQHNQ